MRGRLDEFTTGDILQLFQIAARTGVVRVWCGGEAERRIYVNNGRVSGASAEGWDLITEVRKLEWLTTDMRTQLDMMERTGAATGLSLLIRSLLDQPRWGPLVELQLERVLYPALTWTHGEFEAEIESTPRVAPMRIDLSPQELVLNAARWVEETRSAEAGGIHVDSRWQRSAEWASAVGTATAEKAMILRLLYRPRSIDDLCTSAGLSSLRVFDLVRKLRSEGIVSQT